MSAAGTSKGRKRKAGGAEDLLAGKKIKATEVRSFLGIPKDLVAQII